MVDDRGCWTPPQSDYCLIPSRTAVALVLDAHRAYAQHLEEPRDDLQRLSAGLEGQHNPSPLLSVLLHAAFRSSCEVTGGYWLDEAQSAGCSVALIEREVGL